MKKIKGTGVKRKKAAGLRTGGAKPRRKKKAAGLGSDFGNMVLDAAGTAIGVVIDGVYKAGKAAVKQFVKKKGGATRVKKKAGMRLGGAKPKRAGRANPWLAHVKKTMKANKGMAFKAVLKKAKASYKKK